MPIFTMPLQDHDAEPAIDLKVMLDHLYELGRYALQIDYTQDPPEPQLSPAEAEWCDRSLKENHLRP